LGYPALLTAAFSVLGARAEAGQLLNVLLGAALSPGVYVLARQIGSGMVGALVAGVLMAVCGQAVQSSLVIMADIPALAWAVLSAIALWVYLRGGSRGWLIASATLLALAGVTRWLYLALVIPWGMGLILTRPLRWRDVLIAALPAVGLLALQLLYSRASPYATFSHAWVQGWSLENAFRREFVNVDGHFLYDLENWRFYAQPFYEVYYLAPIFIPLLLIGLLALIQAKERTVWIMLAAWALVPYSFLAGIPYQNIRFPLIVFPAVALLVGFGIHAVLQWSKRQHSRLLVVRAAIGLLIVVGSAQTFITAQDNIQTSIANQQGDKAVARWAAQQIPADETVFTFGLTLTLKQYTTLDVYEIYYESPETLAERWSRGRDDYLLLNVWNIENQWAGREPQVAFHWLRDTRGLVELGRYGNYTLYKVEG
jgi:4-amino-4-deoxy-L-arabinose transferase-like glycosyltransferase